MEIETIQDVLREKNELAIEDYYSLAAKIYENFDIAAHKKGYGYQTTRFPIFDKKIEGLEEGLYLFAGESNSGKTAIATNLIWDLCSREENHLFGIYYSLDDNTNEVVPRLIAMNQGIPISVASKPQRYLGFLEQTKSSNDQDILMQRSQYIEWLDKRNAGLQ